MPFTFNGFGTSLYGARDFQPDGSYTTTEWIVGIYFPVWPLKSLRILPSGKNTNVVFFSSTGYSIIEKQSLHSKQVLFVYLGFALFVASAWAAIGLEVWWLSIPAVAMLFIPRLMRRAAIKRMQKVYSSEEKLAQWQVREQTRIRNHLLASGMKQCSKCDFIGNPESKFCVGCGMPMEAVDEWQ